MEQHLLTKEEILAGLENDPFLEIFEQTEKTAVVYDHKNGNGITYYFPEYYTPQDLRAKIHILSSMPQNACLDVDRLTQYLWENLDHNAFVTLDGVWIVNEFGDFRKIADHYQNEDVLELADLGVKGFFWFIHQACVVDVPRIIDYLKKKEQQVDFDRRLRERILEVLIHELRHQMLDATLVLPKEIYKKEWGSEFLVDRFAWELCDDSDIDSVFL